jgi:hypothetical protein
MNEAENRERVCLFCARQLAGCRSREHVLPQWLLDHLKIRKDQVSPTHFDEAGKAKSTRHHNLAKLLHGQVCRDCNNGWMSALEGACKAVLTDLFAVEREVIDLSSDERILLARWATKTAAVLNSASNFITIVPATHYQSLFANDKPVPSGVAVYAQQHHPTRPFYWLQSQVWVGQTNQPDMFKALAQSSYKVALQLGALLLVVAWWPHPGWLMSPIRGVHVPLWPQRGPVYWQVHEADAFPWNDSVAAIAAFSNGLCVGQASEATGGAKAT